MLFAIDIDNTITCPRWFDADVEITARHYIQAGIISEDDIQGFEYHPQLYLLPQVAITHMPMEGAVETLQRMAVEGSVQYFTARNHIKPALCQRIHANTHTWLKHHHFPNPMGVRFLWDIADKLLQALETTEPQSILIDDRPEGLIQAFLRIAERDPRKASVIQERIILIAFGCTNIQHLSSSNGLRVFPLESWHQFSKLHADLGMSL